MPPKGRSEGVQIRLDPMLKQEARVYLAMANMTWQELLEPCVRKFVEDARAQGVQNPLRFGPRDEDAEVTA